MSTVKANSIYDLNGGSNAVLYGVASPPSSMGFRNRLINGGMVFDQRNVGASISFPSGDGNYCLDRWRLQRQGAGTMTIQRVTSAPAGFTNAIRFTVTGASSPAAGDYYTFGQIIEGNNCADFVWGTASAQNVTLSFWINSSVPGTYSASLYNWAGTNTYPATFTVNAANTWEYKAITIPGAVAGTWATGNTGSVYFRIDLGSGSNFNGTANSWNTSGQFRTSSSVNFISNAGATLSMTGAQLEVGSFPSGSVFERREYGRELILCQRYFEKSFDTEQAPAHNTGEFLILPNSGSLGCGGNTYTAIFFKVSKRARSGSLRLYDPFSSRPATENWWRSFPNNCSGGNAVGPNAGFALDVYENFISGYFQAFTDGGVAAQWTISSEI